MRNHEPDSGGVLTGGGTLSPSPSRYTAATGAGLRLTHNGPSVTLQRGAQEERAHMTGMPDIDASAWRRLGETLRRCREDLDPRYAARGGLTLFAEERGINRRVAWDIEEAKRDNYTRATRREVEIAYGLPVRTIDDLLGLVDGWTAEEWRLAGQFVRALRARNRGDGGASAEDQTA